MVTSRETRAEESHQTNHKFEDLFIWKVSDELKLSVPEEKSFSDFIRGLNQKKSQLNDQIQETLKKLSATTSQKKATDQLVAQYRTQLKALNNLNVEEIDQIKKILGSEKVAQYLVLKNDLATQLKAKLSAPDPTKPKTDLPAPKIIEEQ